MSSGGVPDATRVPVLQGDPGVTGTGRTSLARRVRPYRRGMDNRDEVRDFLSSRRAKLTPAQAGLTAYGANRRVPGLRREEVAMLAGVSSDYYVRLERGNLAGVSDSILEAIATALQLDEAERQHLHDLARAAGPRPARNRRRAALPVPPSVQVMLDAMTGAPAVVRNDRLDILARTPSVEPSMRHCSPDRPTSTAGRPTTPIRVPRPRRARLLDRLEEGRRRHGRHPAHGRRKGPVRQGCSRSRRRAVHAQRGVPHPVGPPRRPPAPRRRQADQPPGRRPSRPDVRHRCRSPRRPA